MGHIVAFLVLLIGISTVCSDNSPKGPYWRDIKYGKRGFSYHGLKFGGVYTDDDFKFPEEAHRSAEPVRARSQDETNILATNSIHSPDLVHLGSKQNHTIKERTHTEELPNDLNLDREEYIPRIEKESHIINPPSIVPEVPTEEKVQELVLVGKANAKDEVYPSRGDVCINCSTKPLYVRDITTPDKDDSQYTTKPSYETTPDKDDSQYTTKPSYETTPDKDDTQYTTKPSYETTPDKDDSQYTTKPSYETTPDKDDSQYTTKPSYETTPDKGDSQYTTKPSYETTPDKDDSQYTTKPSYETTPDNDDSQYTTKPSYETTPDKDDSQYTTKPSYETTPDKDDSQYTTKPSYETTPDKDDSQYTTKPSYETTPDKDDSQYTTKPSYETTPDKDDTQYTTKPSYETTPDKDDSQYTTKPSYETTPDKDDSQYTTKPSYETTPDKGDSQYTTKPSYETTPDKDDSQYTTKPSYETTPDNDDSQYTTKPSYETTPYKDDSQYTTKPSYETTPDKDDSQYTTKPSYETTPDKDDSQYTTKPYFYDEWVWETKPTTSPFRPIYPSYEHHPMFSVYPVVHENPYYDGVEYPTMLVSENPQMPGEYSGVQFQGSGFDGFGYTVNHAIDRRHQAPGVPETYSYPALNYHTVTAPKPIYPISSTEVPSVKGHRKPQVYTIPTTGIPTKTQPPYTTKVPVKGEIPATSPSFYQTAWYGYDKKDSTQYHQYDVTTAAEDYEVETSHPFVLKPKKRAYTTKEPVTYETPPATGIKGGRKTPKPYVPTTTPYDTTTLTYEDPDTTTPFFFTSPLLPTTEKSHVKGHPKINPPLTTTTEVPVTTTEVPLTTTEKSYVKGHPKTYPSVTTTTEVPVTTEKSHVKGHPKTHPPVTTTTEVPVTTTERSHVKGHPKTYPSVTTEVPVTTEKSHVKGHPKTHPPVTTTTEVPVTTTEKFYVKGHPKTYPPVTTEVPVETTHPPITSTTKAKGIKGHHPNFITPPTTEYPTTTPKAKGVKGGRRVYFAIPEAKETPTPPPVKTGIKGYRRLTDEPSLPLYELSEEISSDKNTRLNKGVHFYFAPRRQVKRDVSDNLSTTRYLGTSTRLTYSTRNPETIEEIDHKAIKGKKKPLKNVFLYDPESAFKGFQQDVKGHAAYDIKRPEIKGRSGDKWKKYFTDYHTKLSDWEMH
ncbi:hypothetical protein M8J75_005681 [Diaphorina citri]|nr:hypothetical protein M8J75_005681 [Diaphorina citri]